MVLFLTRIESEERMACFEAIFFLLKNSIHSFYSLKGIR